MDQAIILDDSTIAKKYHPLDLMNFKGACSYAHFNEQFLQLCYAIGIGTYLTNVLGSDVYDFELDDEKYFLDLKHQQIYLKLDNEGLASSEEVMDDPFLVLRTKHKRSLSSVNFEENWKQLAKFDIFSPNYTYPIEKTTTNLISRSKGYDLFPGESLIFETAKLNPELNPYECGVRHVIKIEARNVSHQWEYDSPFPIQQITNHSDVILHLIDQKIDLKPQETYELKGEIFV